MTKFNLSNEIIRNLFNKKRPFIDVEDVKEFIKRIETRLCKRLYLHQDFIEMVIREEAGNKLIDSPQSLGQEDLKLQDGGDHSEDKEPDDSKLSLIDSGSDDVCECGHDFDLHIENFKKLHDKFTKGCLVEDCSCKKFKPKQEVGG